MARIRSAWLTAVWPWFAAAAAATMLAAAHLFQRLAGLDPCPLCLRQREVYWAILALCGVGLAVLAVRRFAAGPRILAGLLALGFLTSLGFAGYHVGVEQGWIPVPDACAGGAAGLDPNRTIAEQLSGKKTVVSCNDVPWSLFGVSMAGYNALISLGLALISAVAALGPARQETP